MEKEARNNQRWRTRLIALNAASIVILTFIIAATPFWLQSKTDATERLEKAAIDMSAKVEKIENALSDVTARITALEQDTTRLRKE